jgi:PIN domain nuclease of toxin-antitoxin system
VKLILDAHVLLWWLGAPEKLDQEGRQAIASAGNLVYLSAAVMWEIRIKEGLGKLKLPKNFEPVVAKEAFEELPIRLGHVHSLRTLPLLHRDPFDRILIAQAMHEGATIVTRDEVFAEYEVAVLPG